MYQTEIKPQGGIAFRKALDAVKDAVPLADYAGEHTQLQRAGGDTLAGCCPIHQERTPSFHVYPDQHYHCFGCQAHGDVIDLARAVEGGEVWEAMMTLSMRYGVELPQRPDRWHQHQDEKAKDRHRLRNILARSYRRRLFRVYYSEYLETVEPEIREEEGRRLWEDLWPTALAMAERRMSR